MKVLAYFLPQFHEVDENNLWWGEGYTEWTTLKRENKFSDGLKPLGDNYYNLLDHKTVEWQTSLMREYGIYGLCYYHYWFKGKKILEKPAENLLRKYKDIDQKFCFLWANHSWYKSTSGKIDDSQSKSTGGKTLLLEQAYGDEKNYEEHFNYLKDFFLDERYIKIDNKPLFSILNGFDEKSEYINYLNNACKSIGFDGIFFVESISDDAKISQVDSKSNAIIIREPDHAIRKRTLFDKISKKISKEILLKTKLRFFVPTYSAKKLAKLSLKALDDIPQNINVFFGVFASWDNTYRHFEKGFKIKPMRQDDFKKYLARYKKICEERNSDFIFFNAWNEWAEGMVLEPSNLFGYRHLEAIKEVFYEDYLKATGDDNNKDN